MLSDIEDVKDFRPQEAVREVQVVDEAIGSFPAMKFTVAYIPRERLRKILAPLANATGTAAVEKADKQVRRALVHEAFRGYSGVCFGNMCRVSDIIFNQRDRIWQSLQSKGVEKESQEIEYSVEDAEWLVMKMDSERIAELIEELRKHEDFYMEEVDHAKK